MPPHSWLAAGVDGCPAGWFCVRRDHAGAFSAELFRSAEDLLCQVPKPDVLAIDIPIGLPDTGSRDCDVLARRLLRAPRASSVFPAVIRPALGAQTHAEASAIWRRIDGKGLPVQAWGIVKKIREIDTALQRDRQRAEWVREVHPELCFWALNGKVAMAYKKTGAAGKQERRSLVTKHFGAEALERAASGYLRKEAGMDDILDAFAALWTAERIIRGEAQRISTDPPTDSHGLQMEMVY